MITLAGPRYQAATFTLSLRLHRLGPEMARYGWALSSVVRRGDAVNVTYLRRRELCRQPGEVCRCAACWERSEG